MMPDLNDLIDRKNQLQTLVGILEEKDKFDNIEEDDLQYFKNLIRANFYLPATEEITFNFEREGVLRVITDDTDYVLENGAMTKVDKSE